MASSEDPRIELATVAASLRAYLEWQQDTGATGIPRRPRSAATTTPRTTATATPTAPTATATATAPTATAITAPPRIARALPVVAAEVATCTKCALHEGRTNTVFARGNPEAALCFVGEAPGADEDAQGLPFVGRAGQLLDKMIQAMGLD
ncbi:MAG TPA: uracil-DNA glycosylase, partial [Labilithrix sp.]